MPGEAWEVARPDLVWGERPLKVGDPFPGGWAGVSYHMLVAQGFIRPARPKEAAMAEDEKNQERGPTAAELEQQAGAKGVIGSNPPVPDEQEAAAGVDDADHAGEGSPTREELGPLEERQKAHQEAQGLTPEAMDIEAKEIAANAPEGANELTDGEGGGGPAGGKAARSAKESGERKAAARGQPARNPAQAAGIDPKSGVADAGQDASGHIGTAGAGGIDPTPATDTKAAPKKK